MHVSFDEVSGGPLTDGTFFTVVVPDEITRDVVPPPYVTVLEDVSGDENVIDWLLPVLLACDSDVDVVVVSCVPPAPDPEF
jgi:hypothetical protein